MTILFTICGRAGSKGIKNKNIREFLGYSLPLYTLSAIELYTKKNPLVDCTIVVNSDSLELINIICCNGRIPVESIVRSAGLSGDFVAKIDVVLDCLNQMERRMKKEFDMVIDLDITSPLRTVKDIENLVSKKNETGSDVVFSVVDSRRNPYFNMVKMDVSGYTKVLSSNYVSRQQAPEIFDMNASLYAYDVRYLRTGKGIFDGYCEVIKMLDTGVLDLDYEYDFELMEVIAAHLYQTKGEFAEVQDNICVKEMIK